jgi:pyruvate, water dikinase
MDSILPLARLGKSDVSMVGGKAANLGEMLRAALPVPTGFVVTVSAYDEFLEATGVRADLDLLIHLEKEEATRARRADEIRNLIAKTEMPHMIASAVADAYRDIGQGPVAVRSSATAEDLAEASFAGQQDTYLNVQGEAHVLRALQNCWASLYGAHAVHYRATAGFGQSDVRMAVVIQQMVEADRSGVMFTLNPVTNDTTQVLIEAVYGLGEACVSGIVTPDMYIVEKDSGTVLDRQVQRQERQLVRRAVATPSEEFNEWIDVDPERWSAQKLSDQEIGRLAQLGVRLEQHFGRPQDIEWAAQGGAFYIVQARPITGLR